MSAWIGLASADHVAIGREGGFMQVCHGKGGPLRRLHPGDTVIYYSSVNRIGEKQPCQRFTAIGTVSERAPFQADMGTGFTPFRRDVVWWKAQEAPIRPLLDLLSFTAGRANWGYAFRFGILAIPSEDARLIAESMQARPG